MLALQILTHCADKALKSSANLIFVALRLDARFKGLLRVLLSSFGGLHFDVQAVVRLVGYAEKQISDTRHYTLLLEPCACYLVPAFAIRHGKE